MVFLSAVPDASPDDHAIAHHNHVLPDPRTPTVTWTCPRRRGVHRRAGLLFLIAAWTVLVPLAAARPVDPTWITGVYDDGDFDNVVTLIGALVGVSDAPLHRAGRPDWQASPLAPSASFHQVTPTLLRPLDRSPPPA